VNARAGVNTAWVGWFASLPVTVSAPVWSSAHLAGTTILLPGQGMKDALAGFILAGLASFLPDLDHHNSTVGRYVPRWIRGLMGGHRMLTHSALSVLFAWGLTGWLLSNWTLAHAVAIGWGLHIFIDMLTVDGVGLLYPLVKHKIRIGWMVTGSKSEDRFVTGVQMLGGMVAVWYGVLIILSSGGT